jgi:hypothetical protein
MIRVLSIDDDPQARDTLRWVLAECYAVLPTGGADGLTLLEDIAACPSAPPVIMMTDFDSDNSCRETRSHLLYKRLAESAILPSSPDGTPGRCP